MNVVYVVQIEDNDTDDMLEVFSDRNDAIAFARVQAEEMSDDDGPEEMDDDELEDTPWIYHATCSEEGDYVSVRELVLDGLLGGAHQTEGG